eukprot:6207427-Pleurochrysis_carterae.AAC.1
MASYLERPSVLTTTGQGEQRRRGASAPARWFRCGCAAGRRRPCAHGGKETRRGARALREYTSHANAKMGNCVCERRNEMCATAIATIVQRSRSKR